MAGPDRPGRAAPPREHSILFGLFSKDRWRKGGVHVDAAIISALSQFIASVGFPIAAFAAIFWQSNTTIKEVSTALQDNTKVLTTLATLFEKEMNDP